MIIERGCNGAPSYYIANMTWQELADFINKHMPECNKNQKVRMWNGGEGAIDGGMFCDASRITPYDADELPNPDNFYAINFNGDNAWY